MKEGNFEGQKIRQIQQKLEIFQVSPVSISNPCKSDEYSIQYFDFKEIVFSKREHHSSFFSQHTVIPLKIL